MVLEIIRKNCDSNIKKLCINHAVRKNFIEDMLETLNKKLSDQKNSKNAKINEIVNEEYIIGKNLSSINKFLFIVSVLTYLLSNELDNNYKESISKELFVSFQKILSCKFSDDQIKINFYYYFIDIIIIFFSISSNFDLIANIDDLLSNYVEISYKLKESKIEKNFNKDKDKDKENVNTENLRRKIYIYFNCKILYLIMIVSLKSNKTNTNKIVKEFFIVESLNKSKQESYFINKNIEEYYTVFKEKQLGILFDYKFLEDHKDDTLKLYTVNSYQNIEKYINSLVFFMIKSCVDINQYESFLNDYLLQIKLHHIDFDKNDSKKIINLYLLIINTFSLEKAETSLNSNFSINFLNEVNYTYYDIKSTDEMLKIYYDDNQEMLHEWFIVENQFRNVKILYLNNVEIMNNIIKFKEILKSLIKTENINNEINLELKKREYSNANSYNDNKFNKKRNSDKYIKKESLNGQENLMEIEKKSNDENSKMNGKMYFFNKTKDLIDKHQDSDNETNKSNVSKTIHEKMVFKLIN